RLHLRARRLRGQPPVDPQADERRGQVRRRVQAGGSARRSDGNPVIRLCAALAAMAVAGAMAAAPERVADGNAIVSHRDPALRIALSQPVQYAGADRFVLLGMADCELHAFVEADARKSVRRLYWIQFEQYLPSRPELAHAYNSPRHATLGGMDFYVDTWVSKGLPAEPGSDVEHLR